MSADYDKVQFQQMFGDSDMDELLSLASSSASEEESEDDGANSGEDEWQSEGQMTSLPFTNVAHINIGPAESPSDFFNLFFNVTFMSLLVSSINDHAIKDLLQNEFPNSRIQEWKAIDVAELQVFLGLLFHMGHIKINGFKDFWKAESLFQLPIKQFMSRDRFLLILSNLTFFDPTLVSNPTDPNTATKAIICFFNNLMNTLVNPSKNLIFYESVVQWCDRLKIRHIQGKRQKYGLKIYVLSDTNGIIQKMHIHCGSHDADVGGIGHADRVMLLIEDYLNAGHSLYIDNFYNSVQLAEVLLAKKTYLTGTLQANRSGNPSITKAKLSRGSILTRYNPRGVCVTNYQDKKAKIMISTEHNSDLVNIKVRGQTIQKPKVIAEYIKYMKGVNKNNQMLAYYSSYNKSTSRYKKVLVHVMQVMMLNAYMLYDQQHRLTDNTDKLISYCDFRLDVIRNFLQVKNTQSIDTSGRIKTMEGDEIHLPVELPKNDKGKTKRKDCRHCLDTVNRRKCTLFYCPLCPKNPGLCLRCFRPYHKY